MKRGNIMSKRGLLVLALMSSAAMCQTSWAHTKVVQHKPVHPSHKPPLKHQQHIAPTGPHHAAAHKLYAPQLPMHRNPLASLTSRIKLHGFISAGGSIGSTPAQYYIPGHGLISNTATFFPNTQGGIQISANISQKFGAAMQLLASSDEDTGKADYAVKADWAYIHYNPTTSIELRLGRFRLPTFMYSDTAQVGYSYPWVFLPTEVYRIVPFDNMNGAEFMWTEPLGRSDWSVHAEAYYGNEQSEFALATGKPATKNKNTSQTYADAHFHLDNIVGTNLSFSNDVFSIRGSFLHTEVYSDNIVFDKGWTPAAAPLPGLSPTNENITTTNGIPKQDAYFLSAGSQLHWRNLMAAGEFAYRHTDDQVHITPDSIHADLASLAGMYGMLGYHIKTWLPYVNVGYITTVDKDKLAPVPFGEIAQKQFSTTFGVNKYINSHVVAKTALEWVHPMDRTSGLYYTVPDSDNQVIGSIELDAIF